MSAYLRSVAIDSIDSIDLIWWIDWIDGRNWQETQHAMCSTWLRERDSTETSTELFAGVFEGHQFQHSSGGREGCSLRSGTAMVLPWYSHGKPFPSFLSFQSYQSFQFLDYQAILVDLRPNCALKLAQLATKNLFPSCWGGHKLSKHVASNHPNHNERSSHFYLRISRYVDQMIYMQEKSYNQNWSDESYSLFINIQLFCFFFPLLLCQKISEAHP